MRTDAFDFELPEDLIALRPAEPRGAARLLLVEGMTLTDSAVTALPALLRKGDLLVINDTKVIPGRLFGQRTARRADTAPAQIEILLHRRLSGDSYEAFARPGKRLRLGDEVSLNGALSAQILAKHEDGLFTLQFNLSGAALDAAIAQAGEMPLPPYIAGKRKADARDLTDYQTVYAQKAGAVAAPTAGLHFTPELFAALEARGIAHVTVTLHVGAGTFLPVKAEDTASHVMHAEWGEVSALVAAAINEARAQGGRIVAIGTTSLRILESACDENGVLHPFSGDTRIFITPGTPVRSADLLFTNFHLPRSTLYMLVQAFGGVEPLRAAYARAIEQRYRFYSYGDACLIAKAQNG